MAEREARRKAHAANPEKAGADPDVAPAGSMRVGGANVSFQMMALGQEQRPRPNASLLASSSSARASSETDGIADETARQLAAMSVEEIEEAQRTLAARLKPEALAFLKSRSSRRSGGPRPRPRRRSPRRLRTSRTRPSPTPPPPHRISANATRSARPRARPPRVLLPPRRPPRRRPRRRRCGTNPGGRALGAEEPPRRSARRAAGSAVERDPLRAGEKGAVAAGYTLGEALDLARSSVPAQRVAGLTLFAKVAAQARRWGGGVLGQKNGSLPVSRRRSVGIVGPTAPREVPPRIRRPSPRPSPRASRGRTCGCTRSSIRARC